MVDDFACNTAETVVSNKSLDGEPLAESEDGGGSPTDSLPSLKNNDIVISGEAQQDERITNSKSALSSSFCEKKSTYSSLVGPFISYLLATWLFSSSFD